MGRPQRGRPGIAQGLDSTKLSEQLGDAARAAHDAVARHLLPVHNGQEIDETDGFLLLFESAADAAVYALAYHRALATLDPPLKARTGLHVGEVILTQNAPEVVARGAKPLEIDGIAKATAGRKAMGPDEAARPAFGGGLATQAEVNVAAGGASRGECRWRRRKPE